MEMNHYFPKPNGCFDRGITVKLDLSIYARKAD